jgi:ribosomal protein S18 acetylase RimI-like enzyme
MCCKDVEQASSITKEVMLDRWEKNECGIYPRKALEFDIKRHSTDHYREYLKTDLKFAFLAEEEGRIMGVTIGKIIGESGLAKLDWICVQPSYQKKGAGKALLEKVVNYCKTKSCHKITLNTRPALTPAINLYLRAGLVHEAYLHKAWWKVDFMKMSKWL